MVVVRRLLPVVPPELAVIDRECEVVGWMMVVKGRVLAMVRCELVLIGRKLVVVRRELAVGKGECEVVVGKLDSGGEILGVVAGMKGLPRPRTQ